MSRIRKAPKLRRPRFGTVRPPPKAQDNIADIFTDGDTREKTSKAKRAGPVLDMTLRAFDDDRFRALAPTIRQHLNGGIIHILNRLDEITEGPYTPFTREQEAAFFAYCYEAIHELHNAEAIETIWRLGGEHALQDLAAKVAEDLLEQPAWRAIIDRVIPPPHADIETIDTSRNKVARSVSRHINPSRAVTDDFPEHAPPTPRPAYHQTPRPKATVAIARSTLTTTMPTALIGPPAPLPQRPKPSYRGELANLEINEEGAPKPEPSCAPWVPEVQRYKAPSS